MRKERTEILKLAAVDWLLKQKHAAHVELGLASWGKRRADVIGISVKGYITIIEIKSCAADFKTDLKWRDYLQYADRFFFCVNHDHWKKSKTAILEAIKGTTAGVMVLQPNGYCSVVKYSAANVLPDAIRFTILARMAWRGAEFNRRKNPRRKRRYITV